MGILMIDYSAKDADYYFTQSLANTGFAVLKNHPIDSELIYKTYHLWEQFFLKSEDEKRNFLFERSTQDGYFPFQSENAKNYRIGDLKEFFHIYPWGRMPEDLKEISLDLYHRLEKFGAELLDWIEKFLPEPVAKKLSMPLKDMIHDSPNTLFRVLHYPPIKEIQAGAVRAAPHEDINLITLLPAATSPGLEVLDKDNQWHIVSCDPGNIVVNVGDMLQMCTENFYKSTTHRVVNPKNNAENRSRFSMPLFLHPRKHIRLSENFTSTEYLTQRLREIGIY
ncbi:MAG TPA: 2OG-Fe(II) oxygenase family protein [Gammaproteobacteria bacterium]|nr:2OG-Fe(II) oxygenase family protein [Gammaproteobacteria bacterium]